MTFILLSTSWLQFKQVFIDYCLETTGHIFSFATGVSTDDGVGL